MKSPEQIAEEIIRKFVMYDYTGNITGVGKGHLKFLINEAIEAERKESERLKSLIKDMFQRMTPNGKDYFRIPYEEALGWSEPQEPSLGKLNICFCAVPGTRPQCPTHEKEPSLLERMAEKIKDISWRMAATGWNTAGAVKISMARLYSDDYEDTKKLLAEYEARGGKV